MSAHVAALRPGAGQPPESQADYRELLARTGPIGFVQDALAVDFAMATDEQVFGPQPVSSAALPDPARMAAQLGQAIIESVVGARPVTQLARWTSPPVYAVLARRAQVAARRRRALSPDSRPGIGRSAVVRRVRVCEPRDGVAECTVVVVHAGRVRALAMRLKGQDCRWRVTALTVG